MALPGNLLHMDVKKLGRLDAPGHALTGDRRRRSRRVGWEYVHSIADDCSRLAYAEIHDDERAAGGRPDDIAPIVAWLLSLESASVTGQVIDAEGGFRREGT